MGSKLCEVFCFSFGGSDAANQLHRRRIPLFDQDCRSFDKLKKFILYQHKVPVEHQKWFSLHAHDRGSLEPVSETSFGRCDKSRLYLFIHRPNSTESTRSRAEYEEWYSLVKNKSLIPDVDAVKMTSTPEVGSLTAFPMAQSLREGPGGPLLIQDREHETYAGLGRQQSNVRSLPQSLTTESLNSSERVQRVRKATSDFCQFCGERKLLLYCYTCEAEQGGNSCILCHDCSKSMHSEGGHHDIELYEENGNSEYATQGSSLGSTANSMENSSSLGSRASLGSMSSNRRGDEGVRSGTPAHVHAEQAEGYYEHYEDGQDLYEDGGAYVEVIPEPAEQGWECPICTFVNIISRPGCEMCAETKPDEDKVRLAEREPPVQQVPNPRNVLPERAPLVQHPKPQIPTVRNKAPAPGWPEPNQGAPFGLPLKPTNGTVRLKDQKLEPPPPIPDTPRPRRPFAAKAFGWACEKCTAINRPYFPACRVCYDSIRPQTYAIPDNYQITPEEQELINKHETEAMLTQEALVAEQEREINFQTLLQAEEQDVIVNKEAFECMICFTEAEPGEGIQLKECLHQFCRDCLKGCIDTSEEPTVACPYNDGEVKCDQILLDREMREISPEGYQKLHERSLQVAEAQSQNSFHCRTNNCKGWCEYEDDANFFQCPICNAKNCLTCQVVHDGQNCKEYQDDIKLKAKNDKDAQKTQDAIDKMVSDGEAMKCPKCQVVIMKKIGCDWIQCSVCKLEICWVTKQARWGPRGNGDTSGGCKCNWVTGNPCHPNCGFCH